MKLDELMKKIGKAIEESKPYWEARRLARQVSEQWRMEYTFKTVFKHSWATQTNPLSSSQALGVVKASLEYRLGSKPIARLLGFSSGQ